MWFTCKCCAEKDARIQDLKSYIAKLESQVFPDNRPGKLPVVHLEADAVLSGQQHVLDLSVNTPADEAVGSDDSEATVSEASRILSGQY